MTATFCYILVKAHHKKKTLSYIDLKLSSLFRKNKSINSTCALKLLEKRYELRCYYKQSTFLIEGIFFSGQQRVHIGERAAAGDDQLGGEADGRGDQRDDPGGRQRRRRASQLRRLEHKLFNNNIVR